MTLPYSVVLLDLDLTLFDFRASESESFHAMAVAVGVTPTEEITSAYDRINRRLWDGVEQGLHTPSEVNVRRFVELNEECGLDADPEQMGSLFLHGLGDHGDLYPGAPELLSGLAESIGTANVGMVTNGITAIQRAKIARLDLDRWFGSIAISDELGVAKPDAAIFDHVLGELGNPSRSTVLMVGDSLNSDLRGGRNAGVQTCWYNPNGTECPEPDLVDHEIQELSQLLALV